MSDNISVSSVPKRAIERTPRIGGITPFSASDYPGQLAAVVFIQGCPWRCGYCHNPHLQPRATANPVEWERLYGFLERRVGLVDAVVFSGGEPTIDPALGDAMQAVRKLGFKIGLHTACIYPERLREVLPQADWVGFDVKAPFNNYAPITGVDAGAAARDCVKAIIDSGVAHEARTTIHPMLHSSSDLIRMADELAALGVQNYALQIFRNQGCNDPQLGPVPGGYPGAHVLAHCEARFAHFTLRKS